MAVDRSLARRLESHPSSPAKARLALDEVADQIEPERLVDARLLVSELVTNAVKHAPIRFQHPIELRVEVDSALRVEVEDANPHFDAAIDDTARMHSSGFGLVVVDRVADRWGAEQRRGGGNVVWFELDL